MPEIEISEDQRQYLDALRERLTADHVGEYGHVRARDALQFLIDRHESDGSPGDADEGRRAATEATESEEVEGDGEPPEAESGAERVQAMMNLLDQFDDKWTETDSEQGKYVVSLPDGGSEVARTKDDVRAILFEHYG